MSRRTAFGACVVVAMLAMVATAVPATGAVSGSSAAGGTIRIWTDKDRKADIERIANAWGARRGVNVEVVEKNFGDIRDQLKTVAVAMRSMSARRSLSVQIRSVPAVACEPETAPDAGTAAATMPSITTTTSAPNAVLLLM
jgi:hypothetical protein